tara:strand:+ start:740 stop:952 length:213 start_codon:yes stop_codon:yes gene_type:complete
MELEAVLVGIEQDQHLLLDHLHLQLLWELVDRILLIRTKQVAVVDGHALVLCMLVVVAVVMDMEILDQFQ